MYLIDKPNLYIRYHKDKGTSLIPSPPRCPLLHKIFEFPDAFLSMIKRGRERDGGDTELQDFLSFTNWILKLFSSFRDSFTLMLCSYNTCVYVWLCEYPEQCLWIWTNKELPCLFVYLYFLLNCEKNIVIFLSLKCASTCLNKKLYSYIKMA